MVVTLKMSTLVSKLIIGLGRKHLLFGTYFETSTLDQVSFPHTAISTEGAFKDGFRGNDSSIL